MIHQNALDVSPALDPRFLIASGTKLKKKPRYTSLLSIFMCPIISVAHFTRDLPFSLFSSPFRLQRSYATVAKMLTEPIFY
jgi:hypothetical protein